VKDLTKQEQLEKQLAAIDEVTMNFYKMGK
jgi:hypothetical protein